MVEKAEKVKPSDRGELEITDLIMMYLKEKTLHVEKFGSGIAWLDTGSHESLLAASSYVKIVEERQGLKLGCPEEISWRKGWIKKTCKFAWRKNRYAFNNFKRYKRHYFWN